jgi:outer membrane protein, multidrug efflux system
MKYSLILTSILLAGCVVGPPYRPAPVAAPQHWQETPRGVMELPVGGSRLPVSDSALDALIADALADNLDLRVAAARVREARALRGITASQGKPQIAAGATAAKFQRSLAVPGFGDRRQDLFDVGFDASWEIDVFGGVRRDIEAALAQVQAADEQRRDVEVSLIAEVARDYVELRGTQRHLDVLDARIETFRQTLSIVRSRATAGLTNDLDVARSEALLEDTLAARPALEFAADAAMHRLAVLIGKQPEELVAPLATHGPIPTVPPQLATGMPLDVIQQRPDVRRAERELAAATARIGVARADLYPRIALLGNFGHRSDDTSTLLKSVGGYWLIGPSLQWPLLTGGRVRGQIDAATARRDQAESSYRQTILQALEDVENSLAGYGRDQDERERLDAAVSAESRAVDLAESRYRAGLDSFLAVLDAQRTLRDEEDRLANAQTQVAVSAVALYKALGGDGPR